MTALNLELLKLYALSFFGERYTYGGDDPIFGLDCSGFVSELMRAAGVVPYNYRTNAQGLYDALRIRGVETAPKLGAIVFFGSSLTSITHVGFCLDDYSMIESGGGDSTTTTPEVASARNAFVRLRPIRYRKDLLVAIQPAYP